MNKESLKKALEIVTKGIYESDIDPVDKVELLMNLKQFLDPETYESTVTILKENQGTIRRK